MHKGFVTAALAMLVSSAGVSLGAKTEPATRPASTHATVAAGAAVSPAGVSLDRAMALRAGVNADVLDLALSAVSCGVASGDLAAPPTLTPDRLLAAVNDPASLGLRSPLGEDALQRARRAWPQQRRQHGHALLRVLESRESSIGLFRAADTYIGHNGYSLRLDGLEPGFNGQRARARHRDARRAVRRSGVAKANGRLGRSWGCPALREAVAQKVIDTVRGGGVIFSYYPDSAWLKTSKFLNCRVQPASALRATAVRRGQTAKRSALTSTGLSGRSATRLGEGGKDPGSATVVATN